MNHNDDDRLTPEERAVIDAAMAYMQTMESTGEATGEFLRRAIAAYRKATEPPEPFERIVCFTSGRTPEGTLWSIGSAQHLSVRPPGEAWRVTVTPVERVR